MHKSRAYSKASAVRASVGRLEDPSTIKLGQANSNGRSCSEPVPSPRPNPNPHDRGNPLPKFSWQIKSKSCAIFSSRHRASLKVPDSCAKTCLERSESVLWRALNIAIFSPGPDASGPGTNMQRLQGWRVRRIWYNANDLVTR
jgi:hypothetical protein